MTSWPEVTLPLDFKKRLFSLLCAEVSRQVKKRGLTEDEVIEDFESWRKRLGAADSRSVDGPPA
jgi:hypothetical protein